MGGDLGRSNKRSIPVKNVKLKKYKRTNSNSRSASASTTPRLNPCRQGQGQTKSESDSLSAEMPRPGLTPLSWGSSSQNGTQHEVGGKSSPAETTKTFLVSSGFAPRTQTQLNVDPTFGLPNRLKSHFRLVSTPTPGGGAGANTQYPRVYSCNSEDCDAKVQVGSSKQGYGNLDRHLKISHEIVKTDTGIPRSSVLRFYGAKIEKRSPEQLAFNRGLLDLIVLDGRPLSMMEGVGFKQFMESTLALSKPNLPSRRTIERHLTEKVNTKVLHKLKKVLSGQPDKSITISLNMWTSRSQERVLGIRTHFIDAEWKLHSKLIDFLHFKGDHTGDRQCN